jgi:hypothetical protein
LVTVLNAVVDICRTALTKRFPYWVIFARRR